MELYTLDPSQTSADTNNNLNGAHLRGGVLKQELSGSSPNGHNSSSSVISGQSPISSANQSTTSPISGIQSSHNSGQQGTIQGTAQYLAQLLKDKKALSAFPGLFLHIERLLDEGM